jgi:hypothetical protein
MQKTVVFFENKFDLNRLIVPETAKQHGEI